MKDEEKNDKVSRIAILCREIWQQF